MKTVQQLCKPRKSIFSVSNKEDVLNLKDLIENTIDPAIFFEENYTTGGMDILIRNAFDRFAGKSDVSLIKLTQAMGGGKTHNMIALGLLAKFPECRKNISIKGELIQFTDKVRVIGFSGRETDYPFGIWGSLANQLDRFDQFKNYYSPLQAPGETAWIELLKSNEPLLILLDELPPYFEDASSKVIGNSDLSIVTTTAISNLLVAVNKKELSNVLIVISDLKASYEGGSEKLNRALINLDKEVGRSSLNLEPVKLNTDEVYHILRKKLFEQIPNSTEIRTVTDKYSEEIKKAYQLELLSKSYDDFTMQALESYPFHPAIKNLYARFKENSGFNQTRGLIRLMRSLVKTIYSDHRIKEAIYLLSPHHFDLNDNETYNIVNNINPSLSNAISNDIASNGTSRSESLDKETNSTDFQDVAKLIYFSSLADVPNAIKGIHEFEIFLYLCEPNRNIQFIKNSVLSGLRTNCWYLHVDREGKYLFKNTQNILANIHSLVQSYPKESSMKELRAILSEIFKPALKDVYQEVSYLQNLEEVKISMDKVHLIVHKPSDTGGISPDINLFYENQIFKNRVLFLSGDRSGMSSLLYQSANLKAIKEILSIMDKEKVPSNDPQRGEANELLEKFLHNFYSAARETFSVLLFPIGNGLRTADFDMNFSANTYNGEEQIRNVLLDKQKFTSDIDSDVFRKKCEARLFTHQEMEWKEVVKRSATQISWQWHRTDALERLKDKMFSQEYWKENGSFLDKGPFPPPESKVNVQLISHDEITGVCHLKLMPENGDTIYYEYKSTPSTASSRIEDLSKFLTSEMNVRFLCVDTTGKHPTGGVTVWKNQLWLKYKLIQKGNLVNVHLESIPGGSSILYSTDGSNPSEFGGTYTEPFDVSAPCLLLAVAQKDGVISNKLEVKLNPKENTSNFQIDHDKLLTWNRKFSLRNTSEVYQFLQRLKMDKVLSAKLRINILVQEDENKWFEFNSGKKIFLSPDKIESIIHELRTSIESETNTVHLDVGILRFTNGKSFLDWIKVDNLEYKFEEIIQ
jgi:hypothetical protein